MLFGIMKFNGYLRVCIGEVVGLQFICWFLCYLFFKKGYQLLDFYLIVSVDQVCVGQISIKQKINKFMYNEEFCVNVIDGGYFELVVFYEMFLGYDYFVVNCILQFQELLCMIGVLDIFEGWVDFELEGKVFVVIVFIGSFIEVIFQRDWIFKYFIRKC